MTLYTALFRWTNEVLCSKFGNLLACVYGHFETCPFIQLYSDGLMNFYVKSLVTYRHVYMVILKHDPLYRFIQMD